MKTPPFAYVGYGWERFSLAAGFNAPFGGGLNWGNDWSGRFQLTNMQLQVLAAHVASYPTLLAIAAFLALGTGALVARRSVPGRDARPSPARGLPGRAGR